MKGDIRGCAGFLWAAVGAATAVLAWAPLARVSIEGGFEGQRRDLSVLYVDLPLIAVGGALLPLATWLLTSRWVTRPWIAALATAAALAAGVWGLTLGWQPYEGPEAVY
ncbi:hypothetical protein [Streptomyces sp. NPDC003393]